MVTAVSAVKQGPPGRPAGPGAADRAPGQAGAAARAAQATAPGTERARAGARCVLGPCRAGLCRWLVDRLQRAGFGHDPGPALAVQAEDGGQVGAGAHDRPDDRGAVQDGVETGICSVPAAGRATSTSRPPRRARRRRSRRICRPRPARSPRSPRRAPEHRGRSSARASITRSAPRSVASCSFSSVMSMRPRCRRKSWRTAGRGARGRRCRRWPPGRPGRTLPTLTAL